MSSITRNWFRLCHQIYAFTGGCMKPNQLILQSQIKGATRIYNHKSLRHFFSARILPANILCNEPIDPICPEILTKRGHHVDLKSFDEHELLENISLYDGLIVRSKTNVSKKLIAATSKLRVIGRAGTGVGNIDVLNATKSGILVINTPGENTVSIAEHTVGLMLSVSKNLKVVKSGTEKQDASQLSPQHVQSLNGKTVGVVGLGRVGREVSKICNTFGCSVIGYDPIMATSTALSLNIESVSLNELFARSDYISFHVPYHEGTRNLVNKDILSKCKDGLILVNCAQSGIINYSDMLEALENGKLKGVGLDVTPPTDIDPILWKEVLNNPNVTYTPHIAALTEDAQHRIARAVSNNMADVLEGKAFNGVINAPNVDFVRRSQMLPYLSLAEKLGNIQAQLLRNDRLKKVIVKAEGSKLEESSEDLGTAALKGILSFMLEEEVNFGNAREIGESMGVKIVEHRQHDVDESNYSSQLTVTFSMESGINRSLTGTVFGQNQLRLVKLDDLQIDVVPNGILLMFNNDDKPGVLRNITSILARNQINIASFDLARKDIGGLTIGILTLDDPVQDNVLQEVSAVEHISNVRQIKLLDIPFVHGFEKFKEETKTPIPPPQVNVEGSRNPKPKSMPSSPNFGSGPCKKYPGYKLSKLSTCSLGRSHRSKLGHGLLKQAIDDTKRILELPEDYIIGIVPASDTGAFEMAMWNLLGPKPIDMCYWEAFGKQWYEDVIQELKLDQEVEVRKFSAEYGKLPDFSATNPDHDICFTWNGTTSGVCVPNVDWISDERTGLVFNDATSAAFAMDISWSKIDIATFSWQKVLGGEGGHGMMILSPRAVERLETYHPPRPLPKIFRLKKSTGKIDQGIFEGSTINTPSMLCVEDYLDALRWSDSVGGLKGLIKQSKKNFAVMERFIKNNYWIDFLASSPEIRSNTSVCLQLKLSKEEVAEFIQLLEKEEVAFDIGSYRDAPPGVRIWCGATVKTEDLEILCSWLKWAYQEVKSKL